MFRRVLVANRGAIAVRIARTLRALGVEPVAVYADADRESLHVATADEAIALGAGAAAATYLDQEKIFAAVAASGAEAIHPGYGFLSENAAFVRACDARGIAFLGPTADQIEAFGLKHRARALAREHGVPTVPGSALLADVEAALAAAEPIGYPVMLKSTAGGGGIGMQRCDSAPELAAAYASVRRLAGSNFADDGVFVEKYVARARHVEVQVFGDGRGRVIALGERDCSAQRRNQKIVEETPAPHIPAPVRAALHDTAVRLCQAVSYRSAGTVEFVYDADSDEFWFLEVNTRLQVEHGVTEAVYGIDLVALMLQLASGELPSLEAIAASLAPRGHAIQVRLYAEDPARQFQPCAGRIAHVRFADAPGLRIDTWVDTGVEVTPFFDPMLAKFIAHAPDRGRALAVLGTALEQSRLDGIETNRRYLTQLLADPTMRAGRVTTGYLREFNYAAHSLEVLAAGTLTTVQDADGRRGYWHVGVPPSGAFDGRSFRLGNRLLGNAADAAGLEITVRGPVLRFRCACSVVVTGAAIEVRLDEAPVPTATVLDVRAGQVLALGDVSGAGVRAYLLVAGGIDCSPYLGSRSTFTLGQFGGHAGRQLRTGDVLHLADPGLRPAGRLAPALLPQLSHESVLRVVYGPHGAPEFFTDDDIDRFFDHAWEVHYNSSRTGVRLVGPRPAWARADGGEAGLHPSNIHDNAYAFGAVDFTGDMPVILGPDGPSLGGFVCPATVIHADLWKIGQLRPGDRVRFEPVTLAHATVLARSAQAEIDTLALQECAVACVRTPPVLRARPATSRLPQVVYRACGDRFLLIEYGPQALDIALRFRVHALMNWLADNRLPGMAELTPGIRSLQVHYDADVLAPERLLAHLEIAEERLGDVSDVELPSRVVHLPLSWDDPVCGEAVRRYTQSVRPGAPWAPSNIEFIRRINGLDAVADVQRIVFEASYLVMGLGDVYLGAPVAVPLDPRHRLVTTKYNPARTWTAENSVGIGGAYLCVYGMEGPGGYQFVGRTLQMWNRDRSTPDFTEPWLLRFFDQIRFYPVSTQELAAIRVDFPRGRYRLRVEDTVFRLREYQDFLAREAESIARFETRRRSAFAAELERWRATGQLTFEEVAPAAAGAEQDEAIDPGCLAIESHVAGTVWQWHVAPGVEVRPGDTLATLEAMKMEVPLLAPVAGIVRRLARAEGAPIAAGQALLVIEVTAG